MNARPPKPRERSADEPALKFQPERQLLGTMLSSPRCIDEVLTLVESPDFFAADAHRRIFAAMVHLHSVGKPVELVTVAEEITRRGELDDIGRYAYLADVHDQGGPSANIGFHAKTVRDLFILRMLRDAAKEIHRDATRPTADADDILAMAEKRIHGIACGATTAETMTLSQLMAQAIERLDHRAANHGAGEMPIGFIDLDRKLNGWHGGELVLLAGRPGTGKTALALEFMRRLVLQGFPVLFIGLEQAAGELADRLISRQGMINSQHIRVGRLSRNDQDSFLRASNELSDAFGFVDDAPHQTILKIAAKARRHVQLHGVRMVILDYLQLVTPADRRVPRHEQVAEMSRALKILARELKVPMLVLTQLNRNSEERTDKRPQMSDLRESGSQEQDADTVLLLHRPYRGNETNDNAIEVIIAKQRNGPEGVVTLAYRKECFGFDNYAADSY